MFFLIAKTTDTFFDFDTRSLMNQKTNVPYSMTTIVENYERPESSMFLQIPPSVAAYYRDDIYELFNGKRCAYIPDLVTDYTQLNGSLKAGYY